MWCQETGFGSSWHSGFGSHFSTGFLGAQWPHGADILRTIYSLNEEWTRHIMTKLNPEQLDAVADALEEIAHIMEADEQQTSQQETRKEE